MSYAQELEKLIKESVIPDIDESLDAIFEEIAESKEASEDAKEEIENFQEFKADLLDILVDIENGDIDEEECKELIDDILEAQRNGEEMDDFGFKDEE